MAVVTFTSDMGYNDFVAGAIKGLLLQKIPNANIIDLNHNIERQNIAQAAYIASNAIFYYPKNSFHIILVGLFNEPAYRTLLAYSNHQFIICPDNGVLTLLLKQQKPDWVVSLPKFTNFTNYTMQFGAQAAYALLNIINNTPYAKFGTSITTYIEKIALPPVVANNYVEGQILFIDKFENVIVNITKELFEEKIANKPFSIIMKNVTEINKISAHYGEVPPGDPVAIFNMAGYLEIGINQGNASGLFGLQAYGNKGGDNAYTRSRIAYQKIRIQFKEV
jgi:S-adenosyl-L-methionine hydrolase (adenosine-forming)